MNFPLVKLVISITVKLSGMARRVQYKCLDVINIIHYTSSEINNAKIISQCAVEIYILDRKSIRFQYIKSKNTKHQMIFLHCLHFVYKK